jgi:chloramphenicol 3-O phosphotransferase
VLPDPYLHLSVDRFFDMLPSRYLDEEQQVDMTPDEMAAFVEYIPKIVSSFHGCIAVLASNGVNIIVDHVLQDPSWLSECLQLLKDFPVLFVGVHCPLEELERRERGRNREPGTAQEQIEIVHAHDVYDLEVNSFQQSPREIAALIAAEVKQISEADAFHLLGDDM